MSCGGTTIQALEFFAGIGLARAGMEELGIQTVWANDIDDAKCEIYKAQWGPEGLLHKDIFDVEPDSVPTANIAWASSPCTDLSLAGKRDGLIEGSESSAFFGFTKILSGMKDRAPEAIVLENVCGLASSHCGSDFKLVVKTFNDLGYSVDAFELNARRWLPQSRPRMFVVGLKNPMEDGDIDTAIRPDRVAWIHGESELRTHITPLGDVPHLLPGGLSKLIEQLPAKDGRWWSDERKKAFINSLSTVQKKRFKTLKKSGDAVRTAYRRTRNGKPVWEMRDDDISGCLRTTRGGSSKQAVVIFANGEVRMRWMTGLEYARLQGAGDFALEDFRESQIQYAFGDAVAVPAVKWLVENAILPAL